MLDPLVAALRKYWAGKWRCMLGFHQTVWGDELKISEKYINCSYRMWLTQFGRCGRCGIIKTRWISPVTIKDMKNGVQTIERPENIKVPS